MAGITELSKLLKGVKPEIINENLVFCTIPEKSLSKIGEDYLMIFKEKEGITLIMDKELADKYALRYEKIWAMVTLTVHSDLQAVGFLAKITEVLAKEKIPVNVVSAYFHDHLFVPSNKIDKTLEVLNSLSR